MVEASLKYVKLCQNCCYVYRVLSRLLRVGKDMGKGDMSAQFLQSARTELDHMQGTFSEDNSNCSVRDNLMRTLLINLIAIDPLY